MDRYGEIHRNPRSVRGALRFYLTSRESRQMWKDRDTVYKSPSASTLPQKENFCTHSFLLHLSRRSLRSLAQLSSSDHLVWLQRVHPAALSVSNSTKNLASLNQGRHPFSSLAFSTLPWNIPEEGGCGKAGRCRRIRQME